MNPLADARRERSAANDSLISVCSLSLAFSLFTLIQQPHWLAKGLRFSMEDGADSSCPHTTSSYLKMTIFDNVEGKKDDERNWPFELNITNRKGAGQLLRNQRADGAKIHPLNADNIAHCA